MAVTLRQSAEGTMINTASASWDATFASVPNAGSLLVAVASFRQTSDGGRTAVLTSGWTNLLLREGASSLGCGQRTGRGCQGVSCGNNGSTTCTATGPECR